MFIKLFWSTPEKIRYSNVLKKSGKQIGGYPKIFWYLIASGMCTFAVVDKEILPTSGATISEVEGGRKAEI